MVAKKIPDGYHTVTPYLVAEDVDKLLDFLVRAFGAKGGECLRRPDGKVWHAEVRIGDSPVMMGASSGDWKPMPAALYVYVPDVDSAYKRAIEAGAKPVMPPANQFYGDRSGGVADPAGNMWWLATRVEDVPPEELAKRAAAANGKA